MFQKKEKKEIIILVVPCHPYPLGVGLWSPWVVRASADVNHLVQDVLRQKAYAFTKYLCQMLGNAKAGLEP